MQKRQLIPQSLIWFILIRYVVLYIVIVLAYEIIPLQKLFIYNIPTHATYVPHWFGAWANFDGNHYLHIARDGYHQYDQAFFPLLPLLIQGVSKITSTDHFIAGYFISQLFFISGIYVLNRLLKEFFKVKNYVWFTVLLLLFPTSFFFNAVYSESILLFLMTSGIYLIFKKKYFPFIIVAISGSLARLQGIFLAIPVAVYLLSQKKMTYLFLALVPFVGLLLYMWYLLYSVGDPLYFFTAQPAFGAQRSTSIILLPQVYYRYLKIFLTAAYNYQYLIAVLEFILFNFGLLLTLVHLYRTIKFRIYSELGIAIFSLANLLLPTLTGTFSSVPRYLLFVWSPFFILLRAPKKFQYLYIILAGIGQVILFALFSQGYFVS